VIGVFIVSNENEYRWYETDPAESRGIYFFDEDIGAYRN
jgi:hypothetical protein